MITCNEPRIKICSNGPCMRIHNNEPRITIRNREPRIRIRTNGPRIQIRSSGSRIRIRSTELRNHNNTKTIAESDDRGPPTRRVVPPHVPAWGEDGMQHVHSLNLTTAHTLAHVQHLFNCFISTCVQFHLSERIPLSQPHNGTSGPHPHFHRTCVSFNR